MAGRAATYFRRAHAPRHVAGTLRSSGPRGIAGGQVVGAQAPYEGASQDRMRYGWSPSLASYDSLLIPNLALLRARSRDAARNGLAAGIIRTLVDYIVGAKGLRRQSRLNAELFGGNEETAREAERQLEAAHKRRTRGVDVSGRMGWGAMQRLACRLWLVDGDALANLVLSPLTGSVAVEMVDADRLDTPPGQGANPLVRAGVEVDAAGIPIAYHIASRHPNELLAVQAAITWRRVPRWNALGRPNVLHVFEQLGAGQTRGEPVGTAVLDRLDDYAEFLRCKLFQARTDAMQSYWITSEGESGYEDVVAGGEQDDRGTPIEDVEYGTTRYLKPGENIKIPEGSRPGAELQNFRQAVQAEIGAGVGLTLSLVSKDFSKTTWHAARQESLEIMRTSSARQQLLIDQFVRPLDDIWCEDAILAGEVPLIPPSLYWADPVGFLEHTYQVPVRGLVDPGQENAASQAAIDGYMSTLADECAARGKDWQETIDQLAREEAYRKSRGLAKTVSAAPAPPQRDGEEDDGEDQDEDKLDRQEEPVTPEDQEDEE